MENNSQFIHKNTILRNINENIITKYQKGIFINFIILYLVITVVLQAFGPIDYAVKHPFFLYSYLLFSFFLLYLGFILSVNGKRYSSNKVNIIFKNPLKLFKIATLIYLVLIPITLYARTGSYFFDFSQLSDLGGAYLKRYYYIGTRGRSSGEWLRIIFSPLTVAYIPLGYIYWKKISRLYKISFFIGIISFLLVDILSGTNKAIADFLISSFVLLLITSVKTSFSYNSPQEINKIIKKKVKRILLYSSLAFFCFVIFFSNVMESRLNGVYSDSNNVNYNHILLYLLPNNNLKQGVIYLTSYLTQGYHAVDLSFDKPFESTFGLGSSMYILDSTAGWFNTDYFIKRSYINKNYVEDGWHAKIKWSSFYVWIANDVSFIGVLFVLFIIGKIMGICWRKILLTNEVDSLVLFCILTQLCFYIPANNQVMQLAESLFGTLVWLGIWMTNIALKKVRKD